MEPSTQDVDLALSEIERRYALDKRVEETAKFCRESVASYRRDPAPEVISGWFGALGLALVIGCAGATVFLIIEIAGRLR